MLISSMFSNSQPYLVNCASVDPWRLPRVLLAKMPLWWRNSFYHSFIWRLSLFKGVSSHCLMTQVFSFFFFLIKCVHLLNNGFSVNYPRVLHAFLYFECFNLHIILSAGTNLVNLLHKLLWSVVQILLTCMRMLTFFKKSKIKSFLALLSTAGLTQTIEGTNTCTFKYRSCCSSPTQPSLSPGLPAHRAYQGQETWSGQLWNKCVMEEISSSFPVLEFHLCPEA